MRKLVGMRKRRIAVVARGRIDRIINRTSNVARFEVGRTDVENLVLPVSYLLWQTKNHTLITLVNVLEIHFHHMGNCECVYIFTIKLVIPSPLPSEIK
jgi:hypothetical protein